MPEAVSPTLLILVGSLPVLSWPSHSATGISAGRPTSWSASGDGRGVDLQAVHPFHGTPVSLSCSFSSSCCLPLLLLQLVGCWHGLPIESLRRPASGGCS